MKHNCCANIKLIFFIGLTFLLLSGCKDSNKSIRKIENLKSDDDSFFSCKYQNSERSFILYTPKNKTDQTPLIFMLHGYGSSGEGFRVQTHFDEKALLRGYAIVYVNGISDPESKTSGTGWNSGLNNSSKDDVGFLCSLTETLQNDYGFSKKRTFAVGFSNGAFLIHRLAVETKTFNALASVSGFLPKSIWEKRPRKISSAFLQITGTNDKLIPMNLTGTAKTNPNPAIEDVLAYYQKGQKTSEKVQHIIIQHGEHSWPEEKFAGFNVNEKILDFFDNY